MRKMKTKVSAMLVALCMLVSLLPAVPVATADAAVGDSFTLQFGTSLHLATIENDGYAVNQLKTTNKLYENLVTNGTNTGYGTYLNIPFSSVGNIVTLDFQVDKAGYYNIVGTIKDSGYSGTYATYINDVKIGAHTYDSDPEWDGDDRGPKEYEFSGAYLNEGINTITFEMIGGRDIFYPHKFVFTEAKAPAAKMVLDFSDPEKNWTYSQEYTSSTFYDNLGGDEFGGDQGSCLKYNLNSNSKVGFEFNLQKSSWYDISSVINHVYGEASNAVYILTTDNNDSTKTKRYDLGTFTSANHSTANNASYTGTWTVAEENMPYLSAGKNIIVFESNTEWSNYFLLTSITLEEVEGEAPAYSEKLVLGTALDKATIANNRYAVNQNETDDAIYAHVMTEGNAAGYGTNLNIGLFGDAKGKPLTLDFQVDKAGYYDIAGIIGNNGYSGTFAIYINGAKISEHDYLTSWGGPDNGPQNYDCSGAYLRKGINTITFVWKYGRDRFYPYSFTFTESTAPKADVPANSLFGDTYAYVKDGSIYFVGGLNAINGYDKVGFEVWVNGNKADDITTDKVYTSFTAGSKTVAASEWNAEYVFITEKSGLSAGDVVVIKPYVANGDAKTYHDGDFTLSLAI